MSTATAPAPASAGEAMAMVHAGLAFLATADATAMSPAERARCLRELEQADSVATAARTSGKTSLRDCVLLCPYHHQVMVHRLGWTLIVNPDGTTTAWNKDKTKVLHSHGPPARAG